MSSNVLYGAYICIPFLFPLWNCVFKLWVCLGVSGCDNYCTIQSIGVHDSLRSIGSDCGFSN